jgi:hypothetical protein
VLALKIDKTDKPAILAAFTTAVLAFNPQSPGIVMTESLIYVPACLLAKFFMFFNIIPYICSKTTYFPSI